MKRFGKSIMMGAALALLFGVPAGAMSAPENFSENMAEGETEFLAEPGRELSSEPETPERATASEALTEETAQTEEEKTEAAQETVPEAAAAAAQTEEEKTEAAQQAVPEAAAAAEQAEENQTEEGQEEEVQTEAAGDAGSVRLAAAESIPLDSAYLTATWTKKNVGEEELIYIQGEQDSAIADIASGLWDLKVEISLQVPGMDPIREGSYVCTLAWPAHAEQEISFLGGATGDILINEESGFGTWALSERGELSLRFENINSLSSVSGWIKTSIQIGTEEAEEPVESPARPSIEKNGLLDAEAQKVFWSAEVTVPAWDGKTVYSWCMNDTEKTIPGSLSGSFKNDYSQMIADDEEGTAWLYEEAGDGSALIWFLNPCTCAADACEGEEPGQGGSGLCGHIKQIDASGKAWCTCWHRKENSRFTLTYFADTAELQQQMQESGQAEAEVDNIARLLQSGEWAGESIASALVHQVIKKAETERPDSGNDYSSTCKITVNPSFDDYSNAEQIEITDVLENLAYLNGSLQVTCRYGDGTEGTLTQIEGKEAAELGREGNEDRFFSIESAEDGKSFAVSLWYPTQASYTLLYRAAVTELVPGAENTYRNTASLGKVSSTVAGRGFRVDDAWFGETFEAVVLKIDADSEKEDPEGLAGAVFEVWRFSEEGEDSLVAALITGEDGKDVFRTNREEGILVERNTLYYLKETEAPKGYERNEENYYFYFSPADDMILPEGITAVKGEKKEDTGILSYTLTLTVPDEAIPIGELPAAGGPGDGLFFVIGLCFLIASKGPILLKGMH